MSALERRDPDFTANAEPGLEEQTGLPRSQIALSIFHTEFVPGGWDYVIARPIVTSRRPSRPDPDRWWVYDADLDESECWIPQANFDERGHIIRPDDPRFAEFDRVMAAREAEELDEAFPSYDGGGYMPVAEPPTPRDPNAPVRATIDLDDAEVAEREGLTPWEEHERFGVLVNANGFAVVFDDPTGPAVGIVRYPDKGAVNVRAPTPRQAREQAEQLLANRPYKNAYERVMSGDTLGEEPPGAPTEPERFDPPTTPAIPRAVTKRKWTTTPISSGDDEDE